MYSNNNNNNNNKNNNKGSLKSPINIRKINYISQSVKNDYIYINITNLIGDYDGIDISKSNIFTENLLLKTIVYILSPSSDNKNRIIYFIHTAKNGTTQKIFVYNTQNNKQYVKNI